MITPTQDDVGREVRDAFGSTGKITRVLDSHGVVYVHWSYQGPQDQGYPTTGTQLDWLTEENKPHVSSGQSLGLDDDGGIIGALVTAGVEAIADQIGASDDTPASDPPTEGGGGDFGGGGASGDF